MTDRLIGFEIQVAPYAVAELRIHGSFQRRFGVETPPQALRFLTNALADPNHAQGTLGAPYRVMEEARDRANDIKRRVPVMVVIGNPPHVTFERKYELRKGERISDGDRCKLRASRKRRAASSLERSATRL
ncbi:hypothetical protein ACIBKY_53525 [Nonomuraea sp. NPDC050394]|uniref:hypothetical protein n=1 Tax=Nonomuraea sp. NPDC050394 TaxID=3364363 RepID=UPI0037B02AEC